MSDVTVYGVAGLSAVGGVFLVAGAALIIRGLVARKQLTAALVAEQATTPSASGRPKPGEPPPTDVEPIIDARTARLRAEEITANLHRRVGRFQQTGDDSPERQWFINGMGITTALNLAVMGYGVANLAIALGTGMMLAGAAAIGIGVPLALAVDA